MFCDKKYCKITNVHSELKFTFRELEYVMILPMKLYLTKQQKMSKNFLFPGNINPIIFFLVLVNTPKD